MPDNKHLQWFEISDMTPGLWNTTGAAARFAAPPNAFTVLQDYVPQKGGGLRAFLQATAIGNSGIGANEECMGIFVRNGAVTRPGKTGGADGFDAIAVTISTSDFKVRIYRMDQSNDETTWKNPFTSTAASSAGHQPCGFALFTRTNGTVVYVIGIFTTGGAPGLYTVGYAPGTANVSPDNDVTKLQVWCGPLEVSQARILIGGGNDSNIHYSDVGDTSFTSPATQVLNITPNRSESNVSIISGVEPSDLLIGKEGAPWVEINGDISSTATPVREMGDQHHQRQDKQQVARVPGGIAFVEGQGRIFITDGRSFNSISDQVNPFALSIDHMVGPGTMGFLDDYLFAPGGYVYDFRTNSWFQQSALSNTFAWADPYGGTVWMAQHGTGFNVKKLAVLGGTPVTTATFTTVPYADKNGRSVDIREVQLFVNNYSSSTYVVELVDQTGASVVTRTVTGVTNKQMVRFLFPQTKSEYLAVRVTATNEGGTLSAPDIERVRIGFGINNLIN